MNILSIITTTISAVLHSPQQEHEFPANPAQLAP